MGLDMYLYKKTNLASPRWAEDKSDCAVVIRNGKVDDGVQPHRIVEVTEEIMYWRKANHIHGWFIQWCAEGVDNCQEVYVPHDKLRHLVSTCVAVLNDHKLSGELLPTSEGFFFGSTDYDEWYYKSLQELVDTIQPELDKGLGDNSYYIYRASW